jgi:DNA-binding response OmpR family regulator
MDDAGNGWNGSLRKYSENSELNVLITFLTARSDYSQVAGFDAGADDYITKPIKPKLLVSKSATTTLKRQRLIAKHLM